MNRLNLSQYWRLDAGAAAIMLGMALIAYFAQISPEMSRNEQAKAETRQLAEDREHSRQLERSLLTLNDQLVRTRRAAESSQLKLQPAAELNQRLSSLNELAARDSIQIDAIETGTTALFDRYSTLSIRITGRGTYRSCATAISQLRTEMPDIGITALRMTATGDATDTTATFVFDLLWYTQPQPKSPKN